jgi:hypothetical protein
MVEGFLQIVFLLKDYAQVVLHCCYLSEIRINFELEEGLGLLKMVNRLLFIIQSPIIRPQSLMVQSLLVIIRGMLLFAGIQPQLEVLDTFLIVLQSPSLSALLHISRALLHRSILQYLPDGRHQ